MAETVSTPALSITEPELPSPSEASTSASASLRSVRVSQALTGAMAPPFEVFSLWVFDITTAAPIPGSAEAFHRQLPIKKLVQSRAKRTSALPTTTEDGTKFRISPKPSLMLKSQDSKVRKVKLELKRDSDVLDILSEEEQVLQSVDLSLLQPSDLQVVHPSVFQLDHILSICTYQRSIRPPSSPSSPSFPSGPFGPDSPIRGASLNRHSSTISASQHLSTSPGRIKRPSTSSSNLTSLSVSPSVNAETLYLHLPSSLALRSWLSLLRSRTMPESLCLRYFRSLSGPREMMRQEYRIKRQLSLTVCEARGLGSSSTFPPTSPSSSSLDRIESSVTQDAIGPTTFVELEMGAGGQVVGRTSVRKYEANPFWGEDFTFDHFGGSPMTQDSTVVRVVVWKERKIGKKPAALGMVHIPLALLANATLVEGWYPLLDGPHFTGELKLKVRTTSTVVFPLSYYSHLLSFLLERPISESITSAIWREVDQDAIARSLMRIAVSHGTVESLVKDMLAQEDLAPETLFRSSSLLTRSLDCFMKDHLMPTFLHRALGRTIQKINSERICIEIRYPISKGEAYEKRVRAVECGRKELLSLLDMCWNDIYSARGLVPSVVRSVFSIVFSSLPASERHRGVASCLFLRLLAPAVLHPHLFGLGVGLPERGVQRTFTLLAKALTGLSYGGLSDKKEQDIYESVHDYATSRHKEVIDLISFVSRSDDLWSPQVSRDSISSAIAEYVGESDREGVLSPPYFLDPAADLAALSNAVCQGVDKLENHGEAEAGRSPFVQACAALATDELQVESALAEGSGSLLRVPQASSTPSPMILASPFTAATARLSRSQTLMAPLLSIPSSASTSFSPSSTMLLPSPAMSFTDDFGSISRRLDAAGATGRRPSLPVNYAALARTNSSHVMEDRDSDDEEAFLSAAEAAASKGSRPGPGAGAWTYQRAEAPRPEQEVSLTPLDRSLDKKKSKWTVPFAKRRP